MLKTYKYRLFPDEEQQSLLVNIFGQVRFIYNLGLETKISAYTGNKKSINCFDLIKQIKELKEECEWLKESPSQALQTSLRNLDNAYINFFRGKGFPKFKNKYGKQSFALPQGVSLSEGKKQIFIPKLKWVGIDLHRNFKGDIKTATVSKTVTNKYFVSILVDTKQNIPKKRPIKEISAVGIDLGIKDFAITSDGKKFENKDFLKSTVQKLRVEQRSLARKTKGSNHHAKQKMVVAELHEKVRNQRKDYLHKISKFLVDNYDTICMENLDIKGMSATCKPKKDENGRYLPNGQSAKSGLNKAILDMGWAEFRTMIEYKTEWQGKNVSIIGRFDPSSKACSNCGFINHNLTLDNREWTCPSCKTMRDRDVNAAKNIKNFGLGNRPSVSQREAAACA